MDCPACHHPNVEGARFCAKCGALVPTQTAENDDPYIGQVVGGRFRVLKLLGEGGMGRVYLAEQPMGTAVRKVAVKTLQAQYARDENILARFQRECGTVAQLEHPNTIQFFDFGQTPNGDLYIAMEYVEGESLADELEKNGPMSPDRVAHIVQQICGSLEEAHRNGIVHRDLKPDNVMLTTRAGQADFVKVLDFGIAKRQEARDAAQEKKLTQQGMVLGTPPYMSPEQFTGKELDARSDIYSLGVMIYEMLTGRLPFEAETPWQWATQHMTAQPFPFEAHPLGAQVPPAMKAAVLKALSKTPAERQASARELMEELQNGARGSMVPGSADHPATAAMTEVPEEVLAAREKTQLGAPAFAPPPGGHPTAGVHVVPVAPRSAPPKKGGGKGLLIGLGGAAFVLGIVGIVVAAKGMKPEEEVPLTNPFTATAPTGAVTVEPVPPSEMPTAEVPEMRIDPPEPTAPAKAPAKSTSPAKTSTPAPAKTTAPAKTAQPAPKPTPTTTAPALTGDAACVEAKRLADNGDIIRASQVYQNCSGSRAASARAAIQNNAASAAQREVFRGNCDGARQIAAAATRAGAGSRAAAVVDKDCK